MVFASTNTRAKLASLLPLFQLIGTTLMAWRLLSLATNCAYPAMVVLSESTSPAFERGDVIFLSNWKEQVEVSDIPVMWFEDYRLPMVHRAIVVQYDDDGRQSILTKGYNNDRTDEALYPLGQTYVYREQVIGLVRGYVPYVGWITLAAQEMP
ncbi:Signal peptidase complex catalytic subunit SEC11-like protein 2 [Colletotrichum sojae]|uniref:Signal peptidase complex catalytic subunit SEC11 n=1 Tax=Colletotrichum sojae TaxID=2175907 RepID=A0A8H6IT86_9PEZI|nr:Signal peptidase complex catalytic subunit SEC11-like protein 2 [Colletotrichum sojae]